jgi:hypothetical protein
MIVTAHGEAHHATAPHFYMDQEVVLSDAIVTDVKFVNPHTYIYVDVGNEEGEIVNWRCETTSVTRLKRTGWTAETLEPGQVITINGTPGRREENLCHVLQLTRDDGTVLILPGRDANTARERAAAAAAVPAQERTGYLPSGQPDLRGPWISPGRNRNLSLPDPTIAGALAAESYKFEFDNPALFCHPTSIVFAWDFAAEVGDVYQEDNRITLQYGYMDLVRTIHLDQSEHPEEIAASVGGHSVGWWEGDTLVVDTVGFEPGVLWPVEGEHLMHSDQLHVVERFEIRSGSRSLVRHYSAEDPLFLQAPLFGENISRPSLEPYVPYDCVELSGENNRRPTE